MIVALVLCFGLYYVMVLIAWFNLPGNDIVRSIASGKKVTVIIPIRNEKERIKKTLESILSNDYPDFEVLVVDDHSTDGSSTIVREIGDERVQLIELGVSEQGKKAAINRGVKESKGEYILCTDGDTVVNEDWIQSYAEALDQYQMAFGPVRYERGKGFWIHLLNMELAALVGVGASTLRMDNPSMINGCNYGFRKEAFQSVDGFAGNEHLPSGDDEFLLRKIHQKYPGQVLFLNQSSALVSTEPVKNLGEFYYQRIRWSSKWRHHEEWSSLLLPVVLFMIYAVGLVSGYFLWTDSKFLIFVVIALKMVVDGLFVYACTRINQVKISIPAFFLLQIIYPLYVVFFGIASNFGKFRWRNRRYNI